MPSEKFQLRLFQLELQKIVDEIRQGHPIRDILAIVTPGGGKSPLPLICSPLKKDGIIDLTVVIVPRLSLQSQMARQYSSKKFASLFGDCGKIRESGNERDPSRGTNGYVVTSQSVVRDNYIHVEEFKRHKCLLVLDECHHIEEGSDTHLAIQPLWDLAAMRLCMTGTVERNSGKRIANLPYKSVEGSPGCETLDLTETEKFRVIKYTRSDALRERAIIEALFTHSDTKAVWVNGDGKKLSIESFNECNEATNGQALFTALATDFGRALLDKCIDHWLSWKELSKRSKCLVVAPNISQAKDYQKHIKKRGIHAEVATSDDSAEAISNIKRFKKTNGARDQIDILITVAMAYEGLDVPPATHLALLTHYRSKPWIEQALARVGRMDYDAGSWELQKAFVFVPDDPIMRGIIAEIKREQECIIRASCENTIERGERDSTFNPIVPLSSELTENSSSSLDTDEKLDPVTHRRCEEIAINSGCGYLTPILIHRILAANDNLGRRGNQGSASLNEEEINITQREEETALRKEIEARGRINDFKNGWKKGTTNKLRLKHFGKRIKDMHLDEMKTVLPWMSKEGLA